MPRAGFYAVKIGKKPGIYTTWEDCREQVAGYPCAKYKKLRTAEEAETWMQDDAGQSNPVEQRGAPYIVRSKIRLAKHSPDQAEALIGSQPRGRAPLSSKSTIKPPSTTQAESRSTSGSSTMRSSSLGMAEDVVYTDGSCLGNGQSGCAAGIGVWWGPNDTRNLSERCPGRQTNNRAELIAIIRALEATPIASVPLVIKSDSKYAIKCYTEWLPGWRRNNFTTSKGAPVKNVELIKYMNALLALRERFEQQVKLEYVRGHSGEVGNEGADALAACGARLHEVEEPDWDRLRLGKDAVRASVESVADLDPSVSHH
ncbi:ribonuclease H-like domain-containing protein [Russula compacta]|nr:ribonuclease H-like domain-containing protein [Russula compacta]